MKKLICILLLIALVSGCAASSESAEDWGSFTSEKWGHCAIVSMILAGALMKMRCVRIISGLNMIIRGADNGQAYFRNCSRL